MKKTRRWLLVVVPFHFVQVFGSVMLSVSVEYSHSPDFEPWFLAALLVLAFSWVPMLAMAIYLMFKWTTGYNTATFGVRSKKEWNRQRGQDRVHDE